MEENPLEMPQETARFVDLRPDCALSLAEILERFNEINVVYRRFVGANRVSDPEESRFWEQLVKLIGSLQTQESTPDNAEDSMESIQRDKARTMMARLYFFSMLAQARGWDDDLTKTAWSDLIESLHTI